MTKTISMRNYSVRSGIVAVVVAMAASVPAFAGAPPAGSYEDKELAPFASWIGHVHGGPNHWLCCSIADGAIVDVQHGDAGQWQVMFHDGGGRWHGVAQPPPLETWIDVPPDAIVDEANPTPHNLAWWFQGTVRCFLSTSGT